jgi:SMC interacting uncharacterized protein involved in chromosome segregation
MDSRLSSRKSLLPQRQSRGSVGESFSRMSIGRQSDQRASFRTSNGRPSVYSSNLGATNVVAKDPRPIREKSWQSSSIRMLIGALVQMGYPNPVSPRTVYNI